VFRRVLQQRTENEALHAVALMQQAQVIDLDASLALSAAKLGVAEKLPLADSIILATARRFGATLWTMDADFAGRPDVKYRPKR
jgi:predicted nucleic acid-binding protein